tara:strand:+ start:11405 stop:12097 length:693 start_codon:yes stop_codon:yes gene_type:complete
MGVAPHRDRGSSVGMDPVVWTDALERDLVALARCDATSVARAASCASRTLVEGARALDALARGEDADGDGKVVDARVIRGARALAWTFAECARGCVSGRAFGERVGAFGFSGEVREGLERRYEAEAAAGGSAEARRMTSTNRRDAYDGLEWRLDARVASRASLVEAEAKYLLKLGRVGRGGARAGTRTTTLAETDYQTLRAMLREAETALAASTGAHAGRLAKYVRRPKV